MEQLLTSKQVAAYLQVSLATVYRLLESGELQGSRITSQKRSNWRIRTQDLEAYLVRTNKGLRLEEIKLEEKGE